MVKALFRNSQPEVGGGTVENAMWARFERSEKLQTNVDRARVDFYKVFKVVWVWNGKHRWSQALLLSLERA